MANSFQQEQETPELEMLSELAENLVFRLRGCDDVMIRKTLQEVYREFCRETKCLTADRIIEVEPGRLDYPLAPAFGGVVTDVRRAAIGTQRLNPGFDYSTHGTRPLVLHLSPRWVPHPQPQAPDGMTVPAAVPGETPPSIPLAERHIHLAPVFVRVVQEEIPSLNSEKVPRGMIELHGDAICSGVLARLFAMTGRAWSDPQQAAMERANYEGAKSELRMKHETPPGGRFIDTSQIL